MKLTSAMLKKLVLEEVAKLKSDALEDKAAKEVDADELGKDSTLANKIDYAKALKIKEQKLVKQLEAVREARRQTLKTILKSV